MVCGKWITIADDNQYPVMRPSIRIDKTTPFTVDEISEDILNNQIRLKQIIKGNSNLPKFEGGRKIKNPWISFVKKYAEENNISYACAIPQAKTAHKKIDKTEKDEQFRKEQIILWNNTINRFMKRFADYNGSLPLIQVNFNKDWVYDGLSILSSTERVTKFWSGFAIFSKC